MDIRSQSRPYSQLQQHSQLSSMLYEYRTIIAASAASTGGTLWAFPLDSIKTRLQTHGYPSINACIRATYAEEGLRGFFRGIVPPLISISAVKSISFSIYEQTKGFLKTRMGADSLGTVTTRSFGAGATAGSIIAVISAPFELVKIQRQLEQLKLAQSGKQVQSQMQTTSYKVAKDIVRFRGPLGLYNGFHLHAARDILGTGFYFAAYDGLKFLSSNSTSPTTHFLSGGICGVITWIMVYPLDLVKSNIQQDVLNPKPRYKSAMDAFKTLVGDKGLLRGVSLLYRGISISLVRSFLLHASTFVIYEGIREHIEHRHVQ